MRLLIDQNVSLIRSHTCSENTAMTLCWCATPLVVGREAPDQLIALNAAREGLVIVTLDRDFRRFRKRVHTERRQLFMIGAGLLQITMKGILVLARLSEELAMIEAYAVRAATNGEFLRILPRETGIEFAMEGGRAVRE
jgi:predicted nuclease of predicted toxin-antitoxin system